jgi:predicted TIM-barrel fold metal-dependent hydrolase
MWSTRSSLAALLLALSGTAAAAQEAWTGPIFDAHLHYNDEATAVLAVGSAFELFRKNGVAAILANSRPNDGSRALYEAWKKTPSLAVQVVPFIRVYRNRSDYGTWQDNPEILAMIVAEEKRGYYRGVGEFHVQGSAADTKVLKQIVDFAVSRNLVLHAHCDDVALEILYRHNPKARVIWAHTGFGLELARVDELLEKYPALWGELSYRSGVAGEAAPSPEWKALFTRHPTRFLLGSDTWVNERWASYPRIMGDYRRLLGQLPGEVAERVAWKNAAELFGLSAATP